MANSIQQQSNNLNCQIEHLAGRMEQFQVKARWDPDGQWYWPAYHREQQGLRKARPILFQTDIRWAYRQWKKDKKGWWYDNGDSTYPTSTWKSIDGSWYYFNEAGYIVTGWFKDSGSWYYLDSTGKMLTGWFKDQDGNWYYLYESGAMAADTTIDGYKVGPSGAWIK